ncbi:MAG: winged helix-turn-helix domain-containing protein [Blastocatellia bacterium]
MILQPNHIYEFGPFRLDVAERLLVRDGETIPLQPKAYDLLHVLVEHHGHLLEKDELLKAVWPDTVVEEVNLANNVSILRKALGEGGNEQQFIETVPRRGYRFVAPVREAQEGTAEPGVAEIAQAPVVQQEVQAAAATGEQPAQGISRLVKRRPALVVSLVILLLIGAAGAINSWSPKRQPAAPSAAIRSIAVLPFKPLTASGRDEALELGMADTLITKLSNLKHLIVRPTSAVRKYTALDQDPLAAGREQKVDAVLESSFQRLGEKIRVTVRLVKVSDGSALWAYQCDEYCANIFAAQDAISEKVARALAPELTGKERALLAKRYTDNFEAYLLYVNGRFFWDKRTEEGMKKSIEYYEQTIRLDPNYALAYVGLANSYITLGNQSFLAPGEVSRKVKAAVRKALEIDDQLGEAHAALAAVYLYDREWSEAEKAHKRAIEVNPSYATAHRWYSYFLMSMGRSDEAMAEAKQAQELDPLSLANNTQVAASLMFARRYDQAIEQYRKTLEMDPQFVVARWYLGLAYMYKGQYSAAITEFRQVVASSRSPAHFATLGYAYAAAGRRSEAIKALDELKELSKQRYVPSSFIACIYVGLGEKDLAFAWMEKAYEEHDSKLNFLKVDPIFDSLRSDPRFTDLLRRMRLE